MSFDKCDLIQNTVHSLFQVRIPRLMYPIIADPRRNGVAGRYCLFAPGMTNAAREKGIHANRLNM